MKKSNNNNNKNEKVVLLGKVLTLKYSPKSCITRQSTHFKVLTSKYSLQSTHFKVLTYNNNNNNNNNNKFLNPPIKPLPYKPQPFLFFTLIYYLFNII